MMSISESGIRKRAVAIAGITALLLASANPAGAQETQSQALERLDRILASLKEVREMSRRKRTLEEAIESSVSRYTCVRLWSLGLVLGEIGAFGELKAGGGFNFRAPTPLGWVQSYGFDNGAPITLELGAKGVGAGMLDFSFGTQNWNCWSEELPFPAPEVYDVGDYELVYSDDDAQLRQYSSDPDNSTKMAVEVINSLVSQLGKLGLEPDDPQVAARFISGNVDVVVESFSDIVSPGASLADRAISAPGKALDFLYEHTPVPEIAQGIDNALAGDWLSQADPCQLVPGIDTICNAAQEFGDVLVDLLMLVDDYGELVGAAGTSSFVDVVETIKDESYGQYSRIQAEVDRLDGVRTIAERIKMHVQTMLDLEPELDDVYQPFVDMFNVARESISDNILRLKDAYEDTYDLSRAQTFWIPNMYVTCTASVSVSPSTGSVEPNLICNAY